MEQLNPPPAEALVQGVANEINDTSALGEKGKSGILKSIETRAELLTQTAPRLRFVYTPKHCAWLTQVERWFSLLVRRLLKRASFTSIEELCRKIIEFIEYFNKTLAKPFKWTYKGRPLMV